MEGRFVKYVYQYGIPIPRSRFIKKKKKNLNRLKPTNGTNLFYNLLLQSTS